MLDVIAKLIAQILEISDAEVARVRNELFEEQAAGGRYAASTQLEHPEGSSTTLNKAAGLAQVSFANLRAKLEKDLPSVLALVLAAQFAEQRRDETEKARDRHWQLEYDRRDTGIHPAVRNHFKRLFQHGVHPNNLNQHRAEEVAIIADLTRWKKEDALYQQRDNPWRRVLGIYASRRIEKPGRGTKPALSVSGTPTRDRHIKDLGDYLFNEMVDPKWGLAPVPKTAIKPNPLMTAPTAKIVAPIDSGRAGEAAASEPTHKDRHSALSAAATDSSSDTMSDYSQVVSGDLVEQQAQTGEVAASASIEPDRAREIAEAIYATNPIKMGIYWPSNWKDRDDFEASRLVPALEAWVASGKTWSGGVQFLAAAIEGRAREFIAERRLWGIAALAKQIIEGDEKALKQARDAGFEV